MWARGGVFCLLQFSLRCAQSQRRNCAASDQTRSCKYPFTLFRTWEFRASEEWWARDGVRGTVSMRQRTMHLPRSFVTCCCSNAASPLDADVTCFIRFLFVRLVELTGGGGDSRRHGTPLARSYLLACGVAGKETSPFATSDVISFVSAVHRQVQQQQRSCSSVRRSSLPPRLNPIRSHVRPTINVYTLMPGQYNSST